MHHHKRVFGCECICHWIYYYEIQFIYLPGVTRNSAQGSPTL